MLIFCFLVANEPLVLLLLVRPQLQEFGSFREVPIHVAPQPAVKLFNDGTCRARPHLQPHLLGQGLLVLSLGAALHATLLQHAQQMELLVGGQAVHGVLILDVHLVEAVLAELHLIFAVQVRAARVELDGLAVLLQRALTGLHVLVQRLVLASERIPGQ